MVIEPLIRADVADSRRVPEDCHTGSPPTKVRLRWGPEDKASWCIRLMNHMDHNPKSYVQVINFYIESEVIPTNSDISASRRRLNPLSVSVRPRFYCAKAKSVKITFVGASRGCTIDHQCILM